MHPWRTRGDDDTVKSLFFYIFSYQCLSSVRAHEFVIASHHYSFQIAGKFSHFLDIYCGGDIRAAMTDVYSYSALQLMSSVVLVSFLVTG